MRAVDRVLPAADTQVRKTAAYFGERRRIQNMDRTPSFHRRDTFGPFGQVGGASASPRFSAGAAVVGAMAITMHVFIDSSRVFPLCLSCLL